MIITAQLPVASKCECAVQRTELSLTGLSGVGAVQPAFEWHRSAAPRSSGVPAPAGVPLNIRPSAALNKI